jgi:hypothetical protein
MSGELRNYQRYRLNERTFAGLISEGSNDIFQFAQILNMSRGGMCAYYVPMEKSKAVISHVSIFGRTDTLVRIENIPCKIIYDMNVPPEGWSKLPEMRCGIEFLSQCSIQGKQIKDFIRDFTIHPYEG